MSYFYGIELQYSVELQYSAKQSRYNTVHFLKIICDILSIPRTKGLQLNFDIYLYMYVCVHRHIQIYDIQAIINVA